MHCCGIGITDVVEYTICNTVWFKHGNANSNIVKHCHTDANIVKHGHADANIDSNAIEHGIYHTVTHAIE